MSDDSTLEVLDASLQRKYRTCALYRMVLLAFGPVQPFKDLLKIEEKYRMVLSGLSRRFDHVPSADEWERRIAIPVSFVEACEEAIQLEQENEKLFTSLLEKTEEPALRRVLMRMQNVSRMSHQPSFREYLEFARFDKQRAINY